MNTKITNLRIMISLLVSVFALFPSGILAAPTLASSDCSAPASTPDLRVAVLNPFVGGHNVLLSIRVSRDGTPSGIVRYQASGANLTRMDVHKAFIKVPGQQRNGGWNDLNSVGVGIRGLGYLADGEVVRVHIDIQDAPASRSMNRFRNQPTDLLRVRWRPIDAHEAVAAAEDDECNAVWAYDSGWFSVARVFVQ